MALIELQELTFRYPSAAADTLTPVTLTVADGSAFALLGASGAGKTTLLNLLSGLLRPTSGRILFNGEDVSTWAGRQRNVAQVFQFPVLYESMNVADNLAFPLRARKVHGSVINERVEVIASELNITDQLGHKASQLSLFQKQLVAIGRALVRPDVSVVLLDEPLTAVEPKMKWRLRQTLRRVQDELAVTMIYVTHDQTEALTFADRVAVMGDGKVLQVDTPERIYNRPLHEFVGYFIGSPGMNFVPSEQLHPSLSLVPGTERVGFRPEWATLHAQDSAHLNGRVTAQQLQGTDGGALVGVQRLATEAGDLAVRGNLQAQVGQTVGVRLEQYLCFSQQGQLLAVPHE